MKMLKSISTIGNFCSTVAPRWAMNCVQLVARKTESFAVAASNTVIIVLKWEDKNKEEFKVLVNGDDLALMGRKIGKKDSLTIKPLDDNYLNVDCGYFDPKPLATHEGRFPQWEEQLPAFYNDYASVEFNLEDLSKLLTAFHAAVGDEKVVFNIPLGTRKPVGIQVTSEKKSLEAMAVLMPLNAPAVARYGSAS